MTGLLGVSTMNCKAVGNGVLIPVTMQKQTIAVKTNWGAGGNTLIFNSAWLEEMLVI